jgi:hypothetical protein
MGMLWQYSVTPGTPAKGPPIWPAQSKIPLSRDKLNLVMAVHPRCPCSRASIGELAVLMARTDSRIAASVIFVHGPGLSDQWAKTDQAKNDQWAKTDLWHSAQAIVGVATLVDDGSETRLFGAATSGQTLVYDRRGRLLFSGGITVARGHWGDSAGLAAICELTGRLTASKPAGETLVFGCPLLSKASHLAGTHEPCLK